MRSPVDPDSEMQLAEIEPGLSAYQCPKSGGVWIPLQCYLAWKERQRDPGRPLPEGYAPVLADDSNRRALLCPESGRLLIRYRVGHGLDFHVDRSPLTGGVWLDKGEWQALKSKGLHAELNLIFTASYQRRIRTAAYENSLERAFRDSIGDSGFQTVVQFKNWLVAHPRRREICGYLLHEVEEGPEPDAAPTVGAGVAPPAPMK